MKRLRIARFLISIVSSTRFEGLVVFSIMLGRYRGYFWRCMVPFACVTAKPQFLLDSYTKVVNHQLHFFLFV